MYQIILPSKQDFPLLTRTKTHYLDNASTSQKPKVVITAMTQFYEQENANVHRGIYRLSQRATMHYEKARETVAEFIGAKSEEIIFTRGATESLNLLAHSHGKTLQPGDELLLSEMEHHSNLVPWLQIAKKKKAKVRYIPLTKDFRLDMTQAKKLISTKTKIVSITHMSNVLGTINPVQELARLAHKVGAIVIIDAAQSIPHFPIKVKELDCDFLAFSGHKMCGPTGIGVLYGKKELLQQLDPWQAGGGMITEVTFDSATWNELPWKFEAGTPSIAEAVGLAAAITYLQKIGMDQIQKYETELTRYTLQKLSQVKGLQLLGPKSLQERGAVFSFTLAGIHPHDVSEVLDRYNIAVRGGHHCAMPLHTKLGLSGSVRASLYLYNTKEDINALVKGLQKVQEIFK